MDDFLYVKDGGNYAQIIFSDILYIEARDKYSQVITTKRKYMIHLPLNTLERTLPSKYFCRINRSYIISLIHTLTFNNVHAIVAGRKICIGKQYKDVLLKRVLMVNTDPKNYIILSDYDTLSLLRKIKPN